MGVTDLRRSRSVSIEERDAWYSELHDSMMRALREAFECAAQLQGQTGAYPYLMHFVADLRPMYDFPRTPPAKKVVPRKLAIQVFERDEYRCVRCGNWKDLCADHIIPESKGGEATLDNLQTLCRSCNSRKGARQ